MTRLLPLLATLATALALTGCATGTLTLPHIPGKDVHIGQATKRIIYPYGTIELDLVDVTTRVAVTGTNQVVVPSDSWPAPPWWVPGLDTNALHQPRPAGSTTTITVPSGSAVTVRPQ